MSIKIGKWEVSPQTGSAGTTQIGHKLTERHTGRNKYQKMVRASISNPSADASDIETLEIAGLAPFLSLNTSQAEVAYNVTNVTINGTSNASKFRVTSSGKTITLVTNTGYTVSGNEGTFASGFGELAEGAVAIKVQFTANNTQSSVTIPVKVEYWNGSAWAVSGTFNVIQSSSDADVTFTITPSTLDIFANSGGKQSVSISSNIAYSIELQGDTETSWITLSRQSGTAGTASLDITASAQAVGAAQRELSVIFKNNVTGSVIGTLAITQAKGEDFAISWENDTLTFTNEDVGTIKQNKLTANSAWYIEENIA
ncbi:MAG: BACON domain-containing protein [Alistipes sp.]|nr:BACON domain-containing protein [Alistipes sp.]